MPRKSDESATKRKTAAVSQSGSAEKPKKTTAAKASGATTKGASAGSAAKKSAAQRPAAKKAVAGKSAGAKTAAKKSPAKAASKSKAATPARSAASGKKAAKSRKTPEEEHASETPAAALTGHVEDAIGDTSDGEAHRLITPETEPESGAAMMEAYRADTTTSAEHGLPEMEPVPAQPGREEKSRRKAKAKSAKQDAQAAPSEAEPGEAAGVEAREPEEPAGEHPETQAEAHLERLQKILSQAGIASRRHAEEMIVAGRVMVNGQVITQLGAKADPTRDHIRVDGKMLQGAERHRTFVLNKPKGFVTTVSDPEGRPTVMQFFEKMRERLYPVGRLDYQSEGLLLMTNDGELANSLTRAASGVEKTYLVKVAGQPTEDELEQLRSGVNIDREQPGSSRVRTAPASVRQVRAGDNPWYEVVLTEGRNRELRKMFQAIGHFVEKIRRVGYGPLVLDVEPGQFRELDAEELNALRLTAEGKLKPRRPKSLAMLPKEAARVDKRAGGRFEKRGFGARGPARGGAPATRPFRGREERGRPAGQGSERGGFQQRPFGGNREGGSSQRREGQGFSRPPFNRERGERPDRGGGGREQFAQPRGDRGGRPAQGERPRFDRTSFQRPGSQRPGFDRPGFDRPGSERPASERPCGERPGFGRREEQFPNRGPREGQRFGGRPEERRGGFGGGRPRFESGARFERPERGGGQRRGGSEAGRPDRGGPDRGSPRGPGRQGGGSPGFSIEEVKPGGEFRQPERGAERGAGPNRFGGPGFDRERGAGQRGREWPPREGGPRPPREGGPRPPRSPGRGPGNRGPAGSRPSGGREGGPPRGSGTPRFGGGRPGGGNPRRGPGGRGPGGGPGGFQRPGFRGKPGGGPRRDRG